MLRTSQILIPADGPMPQPAAWQSQSPVALLKNVLRLTAPNPGVMTGPGTNSYLVGDSHTGFIAIDPGPADADHLGRLWRAALNPDGTGGNIRMIVCTHSHPDHSPGAAPLQALCPLKPPIMGLPSAPTARVASAFTPDVTLQNRELLALIPEGNSGGLTLKICHTLEVIHTPGHAANHVCLLLREDGILFTGDHILNGSTTVIDPPDGNMVDYINSLDLLRDACITHDVHYLLPAHGHPMGGSHNEALTAIAHLKAHRLKREAKIAAIMQAQPTATLQEWLAQAYDDVDPRIWPVAMRSLVAHVERIKVLANTESSHEQA